MAASHLRFYNLFQDLSELKLEGVRLLLQKTVTLYRRLQPDLHQSQSPADQSIEESGRVGVGIRREGEWGEILSENLDWSCVFCCSAAAILLPATRVLQRYRTTRIIYRTWRIRKVPCSVPRLQSQCDGFAGKVFLMKNLFWCSVGNNLYSTVQHTHTHATHKIKVFAAIWATKRVNGKSLRKKGPFQW